MTTDDRTDAIVTRGLSKVYRDVTGLDGLDLRVPKGSIFGFLGPNGAGKTTTIKILLGLTRPSSGSATVVGHDAVRESLGVRQRVGYLAQQPQFYDHLSARQTLRFTARLFYAGPREAVEHRVGEMLELVGLDDMADRPVRGFSGGERQRLGIAQAQVNDPELLVLDEPAAALDPVGRRDVLEVMQRLRHRTTIFYSTHILDDVERVSDTVAILDGGRLIEQAPVHELLHGDVTSYTLTVRGTGETQAAVLGGLAWVTRVTTAPTGDLTTLTVAVDDEATAEQELLRAVLADGRTTVTSFAKTRRSLEDRFFDLVQEETR